MRSDSSESGTVSGACCAFEPSSRDTQPATTPTRRARIATCTTHGRRNPGIKVPFVEVSELDAELVEQLGSVSLGVSGRLARRRARVVNRQCVHNAPVLQNEHAVGDCDCFVDVVGHEQDAESVFAPQV